MIIQTGRWNKRIILHIDADCFYAACEMMNHPKLRGHPVVVGGDVEQRHGIILTANYIAKKFGIKVGMALWEARQLCPNLVIVPPDYRLYIRISQLLRDIFCEYSNLYQPYGLDEGWLDVSGSVHLFGTGEQIAREIKERVRKELGIVVSIGVSYNKTMSKLGSDLRKPDGLAIITPENFHEMVWPLPASDLLGVGRSTSKKFVKYGVNTIGDIARMPEKYLKSWLGKWGLILHAFANGIDNSPVEEQGYESIVKSIGNSWTTPRDLVNETDARIVFYGLAESVAERMRELGMMARTVQVSLRDNGLFRFERQVTLKKPTLLSSELCDTAMKLLKNNYNWRNPLRSIGVRGMNLVSEHSNIQLDMFDNEFTRIRQEKIERTMDNIRGRYGHSAIGRGLLMTDAALGKLDAKADHTIHPVGYF